MVQIAYYAPGADRVEVEIAENNTVALEAAAGKEGYWETKLEGMEPGFLPITFYMNGTAVINPDAPVGYTAGHNLNYVNIKKYI